MRSLTFWLLGFIFGFYVGGMVEEAHAINRDQLPAMHQVAAEHFGPVPCGEVVYTFVPAADLEGPDAPYGAAARGGNCWTQLSAEFFGAASWGEACKIVVHEYGHSLLDDWQPDVDGYQPHSADRNSIMHADSEIRFAPCERADPTRALENRVYRAGNRRYWASDRTIEARRTLRRLVRFGATPRRIARARAQVQARRHAYEVARSVHRAGLAELRTYGVEA